MLILHIIASADPRGGGPIEGVLQQARERDRQGLATTHIATLDDPASPWVKDFPQKVFALGLPEGSRMGWRRFIPWRHYRYSPKLVPWLRKHATDYDAIIVNGIWNYAALGARLALSDNTPPYVVFTHGMLDPWFRRTYPLKHCLKQFFWLFSEGPLLANARAVFFTSEEERVLARGAFWPYQVKERVVPYGTSDATGHVDKQILGFRTHVATLGSRRFLLFLSRIHPKKGCDTLIKAFASIAVAYPDVDLVIAGPDQMGWRRELEGLAVKLCVEHRIHWPGMLSGDLKWGAFRACEAFVLPSHQENFGIVVAEAMAAGKPVLVSDKVNIWREVEQAGAGLVGDDSIEGTIELLNHFLGMSDGDKALMGAAARQTFLEKFEMRRVAGIIVDALKEVAA